MCPEDVREDGTATAPGRRREDHRPSASPDELLFRELYPQLRRFAASVSSLRSDPDDLVQEALARRLRNGRLVDLDNPGAYLRTAILNIARNEHRSQRRSGRDLPDQGGLDRYPSDLAALDALTPEQRLVCYLVDVEGHRIEDAAVAMGRGLTTTKLRLGQARRRLRHLARRETG